MWRKGDRVMLLVEGQRAVAVPALVLLASGNGKSLMVGFDGILDGHLGQMPLLRGADGVLRSIVTGRAALLTCPACGVDRGDAEPHRPGCPEAKEH